MKIYIAGRITGNPNFMEDFAKAEEYLKAKGCEVCNPTVNSNEPDTYKGYIDKGVKMLMDCDGIYLLKGWKASKGATLEHHYAVVTNMLIIEERNNDRD